jgi:RNA polymerase sigma factor (sigma-70 family)
MAIPQSATILHHLRQTVLRREDAGLSDGQLLRSFLYRGDKEAFAALVRRHGPMVRGVCRRVLRNIDDADDAFQAAFLVLVRKASTLAAREVIGDWLHGVAYRTALKARTAAARRRWKEQQVLRREAIVDPSDRSEWLPLLDQEVSRLPSKYRLPVLLCDLEGRTRKEAAGQLGWPEGTLSGRLSRARALLARRLIRRGITLSAGALVMGLAGEASARVSFSLVSSTCKSAMTFASPSAAGLLSTHVAALTEGVVKAMFVAKMKKITAFVMAALFLTAGIGAWRYAAAGPGEDRPHEIPVLPAPKADLAHAVKEEALRPVPPANREYQIELKIVEKKNGQEKVLGEPRLLTLEDRPASFAVGGSQFIELGGGRLEEVLLGPSFRVVVRSGEKGKMRLDMTVSKPSQVTLGDAVILETKSTRWIANVALGEKTQLHTALNGKPPSMLVISATVLEAKPATGEKTVAEAERDLKMAENWRRKGHLEVACGYYLQIVQTYPDTIYAERAKERLAELKKQKEKPPARVGQIFLLGNKKISDKFILKEVALFSGQVLTFPDLSIAERKLSRLKGIKSAKVSVIDREGEGDFKDIQISVEEK